MTMTEAQEPGDNEIAAIEDEFRKADIIIQEETAVDTFYVVKIRYAEDKAVLEARGDSRLNALKAARLVAFTAGLLG